MGLLSYLLGKIMTRPEVVEPVSNGLSLISVISVSGSVALVLFGLGYAFYGMGSVVKPVIDIVDDFHDSDKEDSDNQNPREIENQNPTIQIQNLDELDEILSGESQEDEEIQDEVDEPKDQ